MKLSAFLFMGAGLVAAGTLYWQQRSKLQGPMDEVISSNSLYYGHSVSISYEYFLPSDIVVFDIEHLPSSSSAKAVTHLLFDYARKQKDMNFERVYLAYQGEQRFYVSGSTFSTWGHQYGYENVIYMMRKLPSHVRDMNGSNPFGEWTGGMLNVLGQEFEDLNDFHDQWYRRSY